MYHARTGFFWPHCAWIHYCRNFHYVFDVCFSWLHTTWRPHTIDRSCLYIYLTNMGYALIFVWVCSWSTVNYLLLGLLENMAWYAAFQQGNVVNALKRRKSSPIILQWPLQHDVFENASIVCASKPNCVQLKSALSISTGSVMDSFNQPAI